MLITVFDSIKSSIDHLKELILFEKVIIIISGSLFVDFVKELHQNLKDIYIIPDIIVLTQEKKDFCLPKEIPNRNFYINGGIKKSFEDVKNYIDSQIKNNITFPKQDQKVSFEGEKSNIKEKLIFEPIKNNKDIILPILFKVRLAEPKTEEIKQFLEYMNQNYNEPKYREILNIISPDIPIELLSKYFIRLYTIEGEFFKKMKIDLLNDSIQIYLPFIKTLYAGIEVGALKTYNDENLYSAQLLSEQQIQELKNHKKEKGCYLNLIIISKSFLSFSKKEAIAMEFLKDGKNAILEIKKSQEKFNLFTHADIEKLSIYKEEEVLFFPFSVFGINNNFEIKQDEKGIYHVELIYLGKFLPNIEKDIKNKNLEEEELPNTTFKILLDKSGLIKNEKGNNMNNMKIKEISKEYEKYKKNINKNCNKKWFWLFSILILLVIIIPIISKKKSDDSNEKCADGLYYDRIKKGCYPCGEGYYSKAGSYYCTRCPSGQSSNYSSSNCFLCPSGTYSNDFVVNCTNCLEGYYSKEGSSSCDICPGGTYSDVGAKKCINCSEGYYSEIGSGKCKICKEGTYSKEGASECKKCPDGTYSNISGATSCSKCPAGTYSNYYKTSCINCTEGTYSNITGATSCTKCPEGSIANMEGSTSCSICPIVTYETSNKYCYNCTEGTNSNKTGATSCTKCPDGTYSDITGATYCKLSSDGF